MGSKEGWSFQAGAHLPESAAGPAAPSERLPNEVYGVDSSCSWAPSSMASVLPAFLGSEYTKSSLQACWDLLRYAPAQLGNKRHMLWTTQDGQCSEPFVW